MNAMDAYRQQHTLGWTKIDLVLALQSKTIQRIEGGLKALRQGDRNLASEMFGRAQLGLHGLLCGLDLNQGEVALNQQRLYQFAIHCLRSVDVNDVSDTLEILRGLHRTFSVIRDQAAAFEQAASLPAADRDSTLRRTA